MSRVRTVTVYACVCGTTAAGGAMHAEREREAEREKSEIERSQPEKRREKRKEKRESYERTNERKHTLHGGGGRSKTWVMMVGGGTACVGSTRGMGSGARGNGEKDV